MLRSSRRNKRIDPQHHNIPAKANRILHLILIAMLLILVRVWHLSFIQYDQKVEESRKPQRKSIVEPATRATIRDRFNLPLAINKMSYQATLLYSQLRDIPSIEWQKGPDGKRVKVFKRKTYIRQLSELLAEHLEMDSERIEDLIHAKASYYSQVPFVLKEDLTEKEYYRLKMLEKDWPGIHMRRLPKRYYPRGRTAADVIGYMGAINRPEYEKILHEMKALDITISEQENDENRELPPGIIDTQHARRRLKDLQAKAYTIHDYVGKTGIEGVYEEQLRGFYGKKVFYSDSKGNYLRELPGSRAPLPGQRILLSLSAELQEFAEQLLAQNEEFRIVRKTNLGAVKKTVLALKEPWIKGGAIVVMDPTTAEVLALASYPRFNPNDFILSGNAEQDKEKKAEINRWFENDVHLALIWNQQQPLKRERYNVNTGQFYDDERMMTWENYLDFVLPAESALREALNRVTTIAQAVDVQRQADRLKVLFPEYDLYTLFNFLYIGDAHEPFRQTLKGAEKQQVLTALQTQQESLSKIKKQLDPIIENLRNNYDKVLLIDLCRLVVADDKFSADVLQGMGKETLANYREQTGCLVALMDVVKNMARELFHTIDFKAWRQKEEKEFLRLKRIEEKASKTYSKPYLDYLDKQEKELFQTFWTDHRWELFYVFLMGNQDGIDQQEKGKDISAYLNEFQQRYQVLQSAGHNPEKWKNAYDTLQRTVQGLSVPVAIGYLKTMRSYDELTRPLLGRYRYLRQGAISQEKHLAAAFYPVYGYGCSRSHAYRQATIQGSLFKVVLAYEALIQRFKKLGMRVISPSELNPLIIVDDVYTKGNVRYVGYTEDGKPIPQLYKGGRLPRSLAHKHIGKVDLIRALEVSSNPYFSLLAGECLENPDDLSRAARLFSFGSRTGIDLPGEIPGKVPEDLAVNRTGLYAMAIGQHTLVVTPMQTAVMLAVIANGGKVLKPKIVKLTAGTQPSSEEDQIRCPPSFPYQDALSLVGIDFPLFSAVSAAGQESLVKAVRTEIKREIFMPEVIRQMLLKGLKSAALRTHEDSLTSLTRLYSQHPEAIKNFSELKHQILGKTSTSESVENIDLDLEEGTNIYTHVWFGSIVFENHFSDKNKAVLLMKDEFGQPELVVVVYLRYGGYGKEAAPLAAQLVKKWREIKQKHAQGLGGV